MHRHGLHLNFLPVTNNDYDGQVEGTLMDMPAPKKTPSTYRRKVGYQMHADHVLCTEATPQASRTAANNIHYSKQSEKLFVGVTAAHNSTVQALHGTCLMPGQQAAVYHCEADVAVTLGRHFCRQLPTHRANTDNSKTEQCIEVSHLLRMQQGAK